MFRRLHSAESGYVLVTALIALAVMAILGAATAAQANSAVRTADTAIRSEQALYLARAGVERVAANPPDLEDGGRTYIHAAHLDPELTTASYTVRVDREGDFLLVRSTGTAARGRSQERRTLGETLYWPLPDPQDPGGGDPGGEEPGGPGGGDSGGGHPGGVDPGGEGPGGTEPGGDWPLTFKYAIWADGPVDIRNNAAICGDIVTTGQVTIKNNATIWGQTRSGNKRSPCKTVSGSGVVASSTGVDIRDNAIVQGGYCAPGHPGPCGSGPTDAQVRPPAVSLEGLKARASEWWVQKGGAEQTSECTRAPDGVLCRELSSATVELSGTIRYMEPTVIYVDGNLLVKNNTRLDIHGPVTFVATGGITVANNARLGCGAGTYCPVGLVASGNVEFAQNTEVHAFIHTGAEFRGMNNSVLYGNVIARSTNFSKNNYVQHAFARPEGNSPPGLPSEPGE
ncbi:MAG: hypothetical protein AB2385_01465 [Symbiobacterium sp.]|uniref:hypothetical protein n=1 Tax=Symbiobacterium sp. TaxID=1971213 RepID=UPI003463A972